MRAADAARLVALGAIWGASFLFMRVTAPVLGPVITADGRMLIAGVALVAYFRLTGFDPQWRTWWREFLIVGVLNSALPFLLFAYAALHLPAGLLAVLNATAPMFGAVLGAALLRGRLSAGRAVGLMLGVAGVALVTRPEPGVSLAGLAVAAALAASFSYALVGVYLKRWAAPIPAKAHAVGTQIVAGVLLAPLIPLSPLLATPTPGVLACIVTLGLLCGAVAYLLYFRLIADIGATGALTVTYINPVFGVLFGVVFLGETFSLITAAGGALVVLGTVLVLKS